MIRKSEGKENLEGLHILVVTMHPGFTDYCGY
jgi:hypothetical protein